MTSCASPRSRAISSRRLRSSASISLARSIAIAVALVGRLRALVLALHDDAGRLVGDAHGGVGLVDVLAAGARRAVGVDLQVVVVDLDLAGLLDDGRDLDAGERRLAAVGGVERREADEPVHALLGGVEAVGVLALDAERRRLDAGLLPRGSPRAARP